MADSFTPLGLGPESTAAQVREAWKRLAQQHHPDRGGDQATFIRLQAHYKKALAEASAPRPCKACKGTGRIIQTNGWTTAHLYCFDCNGTGSVQPAS